MLWFSHISGVVGGSSDLAEWGEGDLAEHVLNLGHRILLNVLVQCHLLHNQTC